MNMLRPPLILPHTNLRAGQMFINTLLHCIHQLFPKIERLRPDLLLKVKWEQICLNLDFWLTFWQYFCFLSKYFLKFYPFFSSLSPSLVCFGPCMKLSGALLLPAWNSFSRGPEVSGFPWSWTTSACDLPSGSPSWKVFKEKCPGPLHSVLGPCW